MEEWGLEREARGQNLIFLERQNLIQILLMGQSAVAHDFDTENALTTNGAKLRVSKITERKKHTLVKMGVFCRIKSRGVF